MIAITETPLTKALKQTLYGWGEDIFRMRSVDVSGLCWRSYETGFLLTDNERPVSYFRALRHVCEMDGRDVVVGGLGGMVTIGTQQRKGYGSRLVEATIAALRDAWCVEAALAFCMDHTLAFYQRCQARVIRGRVMVLNAHGQEIAAPFHTLCWPFRPDLWPVETVQLRSPLW